MKFKSTILVAAGLFIAIASQAQTHDLYADRNDIRHDKKEVFFDKRNMQFDKAYGSVADIRNDRREFRKDKHDLYRDRSDKRHDRKRYYFSHGKKVCF
jgi:hypothetical protein